MVTDDLILLQTVLDNVPQANSIAYAIYILATVVAGKYGVEKWQSRRNGNRGPVDEHDPRRCWGRENPQLFETLSSQTQKMHDIITETHKGTPLIYQRATQEAIVSMKTELVTEMRKITAAIEKNGGD